MDQELKRVLAEINLKLDLIENRISALELLQERFQNFYYQSRTCADHIEEEIRKIAFNIKRLEVFEKPWEKCYFI